MRTWLGVIENGLRSLIQTKDIIVLGYIPTSCSMSAGLQLLGLKIIIMVMMVELGSQKLPNTAGKIALNDAY